MEVIISKMIHFILRLLLVLFTTSSFLKEDILVWVGDRHMTESGSISINIKTKKEIQSTVSVIVYATYSKDLLIDKDNNISILPT